MIKLKGKKTEYRISSIRCRPQIVAARFTYLSLFVAACSN